MLAVSIIALVISGFALVFTAWAARATAKQAQAARDQTEIQRQHVAAARDQTELQRDLAREARQPYVWADLQPDMKQGIMLDLVVGNSGPTVAHNVKITFDPPLPAGQQQSDMIERVQRRLAAGIRSLAPNRVIRWTLGVSPDLMSSDDPQTRSLRIEGDGPYGPLPVLDIDIDISEWREAKDAPDGSLHHVRGAVNELTEAVSSAHKTLTNAANQISPQLQEIVNVTRIGDSFNRQQLVPPPQQDESETGAD